MLVCVSRCVSFGCCVCIHQSLLSLTAHGSSIVCVYSVVFIVEIIYTLPYFHQFVDDVRVRCIRTRITNIIYVYTKTMTCKQRQQSRHHNRQMVREMCLNSKTLTTIYICLMTNDDLNAEYF